MHRVYDFIPLTKFPCFFPFQFFFCTQQLFTFLLLKTSANSLLSPINVSIFHAHNLTLYLSIVLRPKASSKYFGAYPIPLTSLSSPAHMTDKTTTAPGVQLGPVISLHRLSPHPTMAFSLTCSPHAHLKPDATSIIHILRQS